MIEYLIYSLLGIGAGFLAGMLGIGGGVIVIPGLATAFSYFNMMPNNAIMHVAESTSLTAIMFTALIAVIVQHRGKKIDWQLFRQLAPGIIVGTILGAVIAALLSSNVLKIVFGLFMLYVAIQMLLTKQKIETERKTLSKFAQIGSGFLIGSASGLLGIGGGAISVPLFLRLGISAHDAAGTSSACVLLLAVVGAISFIFTGMDATGLPANSTGFIYWPAVICVAIASMIFVPLGTKLARQLSSTTLKRIFAVFLMLVAAHMLISGIN